MKPSILEEISDLRVLAEDAQDRLFGGLDHDRQPERCVRQAFAVVNGLPGQARPKATAISFHNADPADHIMNELVSTAENFRRNG